MVESGIDFNSYIITNGSLLTRRLIEKKFPQWHIRGIQITLDGTEEAYEARKNYIGGKRHMFKPRFDGEKKHSILSGVFDGYRGQIDR